MWEKIFDNFSDDNHVYLFVFEPKQEVMMQTLASLSVVFFFFPTKICGNIVGGVRTKVQTVESGADFESVSSHSITMTHNRSSNCRLRLESPKRAAEVKSAH